MEDKIKIVEEILGAKFEDWTNDTLAKLLTSEDALKAFTPEVVVHLLLTRKNDNIVDVLVPIKYGFDIRAIKAKIEEQLIARKEKGLPVEEYKKNILEMKKLDNPIFKVAVFLTEVASFGEDYDVSKEQDEILEAVRGLTKIMSSLKPEEGFQILTEILDLLFPLREMYFQRYKFDILKDNEEMKRIVESVNERARDLMELIGQAEKESGETSKEEGK
jgi:hypothetical protein